MKLFAALGVILTLATASPLEVHPRDEGGSLAKRDTEIVYLANCISAVSCCTPAVHYSQIGYYATSAASQTGNPPAASDVCSVTTNNYVWWENGSPQCSFTTSVTFTAHIDSDAASRPLYSWAGWGSNGFKNWNCYRDNGRKVWETSGPEWARSCYSVYYCIPQ